MALVVRDRVNAKTSLKLFIGDFQQITVTSCILGECFTTIRWFLLTYIGDSPTNFSNLQADM
jgi:hypothetical protein